MDPLLRVSVARTDRIHISRDDILASGGVRAGPSSDFLLFLPVLLPRQRLEIGR